MNINKDQRKDPPIYSQKPQTHADEIANSKSDKDLINDVKTWKPKDWETYLSSLESPLVEQTGAHGTEADLVSNEDHTEALVNALKTSKYPHLEGKIYQILGTLTEKQRTALVLRYWHNFTQDQIAHALNIKRQTVQTHLRRIHIKIEKQLRKLNTEKTCQKILITSNQT